ncbi:histidine phosphatase family protein [Paenibacillus antri]|uniref:Histidine phosphatase family protein n=1 Tax=Paenibacillus antri TaxID=2582848 RepID=A0A5R9G7Z5_9BACL|nr:histidine phosphatase family protein [Paenibacillus antri]TLS52547.1 histidine phosphatase family protein [Paenibacillus antri]
MKTIYLIRHCKAAGQEAEAPLTEQGLEQSERLAEALKEMQIEKVVSSPFRRAVHSVEPLTRRLGIDVAVDARLSERVLSGRDLPDWMDHLLRSFEEMDVALEGGESSRMATERALAVVKELANGEANVVAVATHGNLMALLLKAFDASVGFETWKALSNPDVYRLSFLDGNFVEMERVWVERAGE